MVPVVMSLFPVSSCRAVNRSYAEIWRFLRPTGALCRGRLHNRVTSRGFFLCARLKQDSKSGTRETLDKYKSIFDFPGQSHAIGGINDLPTGTVVTLHGYLGNRRDVSKALSFGSLRGAKLEDHVQLVSSGKTSDGTSTQSHIHFKSLPAWTPVAVEGVVKERHPPKGDVTAGPEFQRRVEIELQRIHQLNEFPKDIIAKEETIFPPEQRHLQLRTNDELRNALKFRQDVSNIMRQHLQQHSFLEVETPILFKSTPEGAREFLVPTRNKGLAYALPQSPQQYKQILMASGVWRYFQFARCFRDEDLRADRQPEFTQLDLEMSFAKQEDVMETMESLLRNLWTAKLGTDPGPRFQRMTYDEAMAQYGVDKPDLRFDMKIHRFGYLLPVDLTSKITSHVNPDVGIMKLHVSDDPNETRAFVNAFMDSPEAAPFIGNLDGQPGIFVYDPKKPLSGLQAFGFEAAEQAEELLDLEVGDLVVLQARENVPFSGGSIPIGNLRLALYRAAVAQGLVEPPTGFKFLWIIDFPMFTPSNDTDPGQGGAAGFSATHHPFTAPKTADDIELLLKDPAAAKAAHYDIVVNGVELGGGSRRIHNAEMQEFIFRDVLKMTEEGLDHFKHLLEVLRAGCPPHAGIALGFDRLIAVMMGRESVRDVIAFPKSGKGEDLLVKSPNPVTREQLDTYHLQLKHESNRS